MHLDGRLDAAVESDIVGYTTTTITGKGEGVADWYQIAIQFKGLGESEDKIKFGEAINVVGLTPTTWRNATTSAPCIQVYNGLGYDYYYYVSNAWTSEDDKTTVTGWARSDRYLADDTYLNVGQAFWLRIKNLSEGETATMTVAGSVSVAQVSKTITINSGSAWTLAANPYPTAVAIKDIKCSLTPSTWRNATTSAPCIQVYNGLGYDYYYYVSNAWTSEDDKTTVTGWARSDRYLADDEIPAGVGFWIKTSGTETGTLEFSL